MEEWSEKEEESHLDVVARGRLGVREAWPGPASFALGLLKIPGTLGLKGAEKAPAITVGTRGFLP